MIFNYLLNYKKNKFYGQFWQDLWAINLLNNKKKGFFLDLAAGNGIYVSNTYILEKDFGWKGICIEANPRLFRELKKNRRCICDNSCIDGKKHKIKFRDSGNLLGGIVDKDTDNKTEENKDFTFRKTKTLVEILEKYKAPKVIDYFSFDVEGAETRILKNFPFHKFTFLLLNIERPSKLLAGILKRNSYICIGGNPCDRYFIHKKLFFSFGMFKKLKVILISNAPRILGKFKENS